MRVRILSPVLSFKFISYVHFVIPRTLSNVCGAFHLNNRLAARHLGLYGDSVYSFPSLGAGSFLFGVAKIGGNGNLTPPCFCAGITPLSPAARASSFFGFSALASFLALARDLGFALGGAAATTKLGLGWYMVVGL